MKTILHSKIIGQGPALLILHGFLGMSDNWKTLGSKYAEQGFQVHLIDQRNHGRSFHSPQFDYDTLAKDLEEYIDHHQLTKVHLLGHSMGGKTAMQFAVSRPERTTKLLVADIAPKYYPPHHQEIIRGLLSLDFNNIKTRSQADQKLAETISQLGIRQFLLKNLYWVNKEQLGLRINLKVLQHKMEEVGENIAGTDSYNGPTLFLRGSRSEYIHEQDSKTIANHFPAAKINTIDNAGHWLHAENPKDFFKISLAFLQA